MTLIIKAEESRKIANGILLEETKISLGQYMTPASVASFMANMFPEPRKKKIRLLDPGAGVGSLTSSFIQRIVELPSNHEIYADAYEIDSKLHNYLKTNLLLCKEISEKNSSVFSWRLCDNDFIIDATRRIKGDLEQQGLNLYTHCILNPPYKKISNQSHHRKSLRSIGIETVNQYSAFVALSLLLVENGGFVVAIIPRSFCNGPYYKSFRKFLLKHSAVRHLHLFKSRNTAFKDDNVLQENVIIMLERGAEQKDVTISFSTDDSFNDMSSSIRPFNDIVIDNDPEMFFHIPLSSQRNYIDESHLINYSLDDIGIQVSTGPVVDFRLKKYLRNLPETDTVPLLYPSHFSENTTHWPIVNGKKPNAIVLNSVTKKWMYPKGYYAVVRRFSSKEEKRRIVASVIEPSFFDGSDKIGIENHLNVFHSNKSGLHEVLAKGLVVYLNSKALDEYFRRFSGHTQVNATDLRQMKYPSRNALIKLGKWAMKYDLLKRNILDDEMEKIIE